MHGPHASSGGRDIWSIFFMYVSDIYVYVLIRSLNSLSHLGARRGCVECLQYIYIYMLVLRLLNTRHLVDVWLCGRGCVIEIHIYLYMFSLSVLFCLGLLSIFFMHVSDIYVYVLIRLLNSLSHFGARRGCVECLQYIYIYISSSSTQPTSPFGCVFVWTRLRNRDKYLSIHIFAVCSIFV